MYSFMDGYSGVITKLEWLKKIRKKTIFILEWGAYAYNVMPFGLCNAPTIFQKVVTKDI